MDLSNGIFRLQIMLVSLSLRMLSFWNTNDSEEDTAVTFLFVWTFTQEPVKDFCGSYMLCDDNLL